MATVKKQGRLFTRFLKDQTSDAHHFLFIQLRNEFCTVSCAAPSFLKNGFCHQQQQTQKFKTVRKGSKKLQNSLLLRQNVKFDQQMLLYGQISKISLLTQGNRFSAI